MQTEIIPFEPDIDDAIEGKLFNLASVYLLTMNVFVNDKHQELYEETTVFELIQKLNISQKGIAIAINYEIIENKNWQITQLRENDKILIITATQGG